MVRIKVKPQKHALTERLQYFIKGINDKERRIAVAWLQDFAYRMNIDWWVFVVTGLIALLIALLTVSYQAIKAALANPVKNLRSE